jgi:PEP phosphonomutase and related enzymes
MKIVAQHLNKPLMANMVENGKTPLLSVAELENMGYAFVAYPVSAVYAITKTLSQFFEQLQSEGTTRDCLDKMIMFTEFNSVIGLPEYNRLEKKYAQIPVLYKEK